MKFKFVMLTVGVLVGFSGLVLAGEGMDHGEGMETMKETSQATHEARVATKEDIKNLPNVGNTLCPVTGNPVGDGSMGEAVKMVYKGKTYNLCCAMCVKDFKNHPEKYSKIAEEQAAKAKSE